MFKMQVDEADNGVWHDVKDAGGRPLTFATSAEAHRKLGEMFPVMTQTEKYVGPKRTRVISILEDD